MDANVELLNYIYQNVEMGIIGIESLQNVVESDDLKKILKEQVKDYRIIMKETEKKIKEHGKTPKGISQLRKIQSYLMIKVNTLWSVSRDHVIGMLIKGSTMGVEQISEKISEYKEADNKILDIAKRLLEIEKRNLDELKKI